MEIYYAEDDPNIAEGVQLYLEERGFQVTAIETVCEMKETLMKKLPDIILIDWNLPDGTGDILCSWIRRRFGDTLPILFLTVKGETEDVVKGFQNGADDYMVKPFELEVLYSRITAILRRAGYKENTLIYCDRIHLDKEKMIVCCEGEEVVLNQTEYRIMVYLMEHKGETVTRDKLLENIWDASRNYVNDNTLTVAMKRLRKKLGNPECIKTIRSFGYRMEDTLTCID